ncbi:MAG: nucleotidyl transferase AbiEii/AbiGii toxin family protein [Vicinamibacterales bacterium]
MPGPVDYLDEVGAIVQALRDLGLGPVLVGGMALVMLGSRRVTRDFDFVVAQPGDRLERTVDVFYDRGLELAARLSDGGDVISTIRNRKVASIRLRLDAPASAYFLNPQTSLRIDLLFDYPVPAATLADRATRTKVRSYVFHVASERDLLHLKKIAKTQRSSPGDAEDIAFLEARRPDSNEP